MQVLKETLVRHGFTFESDTDTEVIPKLAKFVFDKANEEGKVSLMNANNLHHVVPLLFYWLSFLSCFIFIYDLVFLAMLVNVFDFFHFVLFYFPLTRTFSIMLVNVLWLLMSTLVKMLHSIPCTSVSLKEYWFGEAMLSLFLYIFFPFGAVYGHKCGISLLLFLL